MSPRGKLFEKDIPRPKAQTVTDTDKLKFNALEKPKEIDIENLKELTLKTPHKIHSQPEIITPFSP